MPSPLSKITDQKPEPRDVGRPVTRDRWERLGEAEAARARQEFRNGKKRQLESFDPFE